MKLYRYDVWPREVIWERKKGSSGKRALEVVPSFVLNNRISFHYRLWALNLIEVVLLEDIKRSVSKWQHGSQEKANTRTSERARNGFKSHLHFLTMKAAVRKTEDFHKLPRKKIQLQMIAAVRQTRLHLKRCHSTSLLSQMSLRNLRECRQ